jgi:beta-glucosidase
MTMDEKLQFLISKYPFISSPGGGAGFVAGVPRLMISDISNSDSATGSGSKTQASTTSPSTLAIAASWEPRLSYEFGAQIARQLRAGLWHGPGRRHQPYSKLNAPPKVSRELR